MTIEWMFPSYFPKKERKSRTKYMYQVLYLNGWECSDDMDVAGNPDFEKLYQHYRKTKLVPLFSKLVVSFVRYVDAYVDNNFDRMLIVSEDLMKNWSIEKTKMYRYKKERIIGVPIATHFT
jgi:hypothetical protein